MGPSLLSGSLDPSSATKVYIATVPFMMGDTPLSRKATTKIVRVIEVTNDRGAQAMIKTEDQVFCYHNFVNND